MVIRVLLLALLAGCSSIGPNTVSRDRFDYAAAVGDSWKVQMLLNVVKLRYLDTPTFLDVQQIVAGYTLEGSASLGWAEGGNIAQGWAAGGSGKFTDRPTLTYRPLTGDEFNKELMMPMPPYAVFFLIQMNWPVDLIMRMCVESFNGLENRMGIGRNARRAQPEFDELIELLEAVQRSGRLGMRLKRADKLGGDDTVLFFRASHTEGVEEDRTARVRELIGLDPGISEYRLFYGTGRPSKDRIAVQSRSILHIMFELASFVDVPEEHRTEGRALSVLEDDLEDPLLRIQSGNSAPDEPYVVVKYRGHYFWIDDRDLGSKRTFTFLSLLANLAETGSDTKPPLLTIPTG